jgi:hypothetical protein
LSYAGFQTSFLLKNNWDRKRDLNPYPIVTKRLFAARCHRRTFRELTAAHPQQEVRPGSESWRPAPAHRSHRRPPAMRNIGFAGIPVPARKSNAPRPRAEMSPRCSVPRNRRQDHARIDDFGGQSRRFEDVCDPSALPPIAPSDWLVRTSELAHHPANFLVIQGMPKDSKGSR